MDKINFQNGVTKLNQDTFITFQNNINDAINLMKIETLKAENPIGHIRMETTDVNPANYLGFGTWVLWGAGKVPVGVDVNDTDFATVEKTGGEKTHTLTIDEIPSHKHNVSFSTQLGNAEQRLALGSNSGITGITGVYGTPTVNSGGDKPHNNIPPYITCYMWKRTA